MKGLTAKDRQALAVLHDYPEYRALKKWSELKANQITNQLVNINMGVPGATEQVAMLQGQVLAHGNMLKEVDKIAKHTAADD